MPGHGKLRSWMVTAGDMGNDNLACALEFRGIETESVRSVGQNKRGRGLCEHG
jgi:hypothetical protein